MSDKGIAWKQSPLVIAVLYLYLGGLWILISGYGLVQFYPDPDAFHLATTVNNILFIVATAAVLYLLIRYSQKQLIRPQRLLARVNRALKVFTECNKALIRATDEKELMNKICRTFVKVGGYRMAWVGMAENDGERRIRPVAQWGDRNGYLRDLEVSWAENEWGGGPTGIAIRTGRPTVVQNVPNDPKWAPWREQALQHGIQSSISLPLLEDGRAFGALIIFAGEPEAFRSEEVELLRELAGDLSYGICTLRMRSESNQMKQERLLLATTVEQGLDAVMTYDPQGRIQYVNPAFSLLSGYRKEDLLGRSIDLFLQEERNLSFYRSLSEAMEHRNLRGHHFVNQRPDGTLYHAEARISPVLGPSGTIVSHAVVLRDVTHQQELARQLRQAQKMEAIATLAGGIAHDFNNILAAVITNTEMAMDHAAEDGPQREHLEIVMRAGARARNLVRQILTLSCQVEKERQPVSIEMIAKECLKLLRASLPATIDLPPVQSCDRVTAMVDPTQIHQVIMNLCTNAADAMRAKGGTLHIALNPVEMDETSLLPSLARGSYLRLTVADTGHGMDEATLERIFDPFFTTKGAGKGTGLGLSVVHAIVNSHGGAITVESAPEKGTTFHVFLPCCSEADSGRLLETQQAPIPLGKGERILLVDDEEAIVFAMQKMLERLGYRIVAGTDSREALNIFRAQPQQFDLVITDQTMPHLTGDRLALQIMEVRPDLPIILCTGADGTANGSISATAARALGIREVVYKPAQRREFAEVLRRVLEGV
jgi:PAS domain S-box-containing protein